MIELLNSVKSTDQVDEERARDIKRQVNTLTK